MFCRRFTRLPALRCVAPRGRALAALLGVASPWRRTRRLTAPRSGPSHGVLLIAQGLSRVDLRSGSGWREGGQQRGGVADDDNQQQPGPRHPEIFTYVKPSPTSRLPIKGPFVGQGSLRLVRSPIHVQFSLISRKSRGRGACGASTPGEPAPAAGSSPAPPSEAQRRS